MNCCVLRKVPLRLAGTSWLVWGIILAQREGFCLVFVQRPDEKRSHFLTIAVENVEERVFEDPKATFRFPVEQQDLEQIGNGLIGLGEHLSNDAFRRLFQEED